jgi:nucleoside-diphosphate-sugar epimerase
MSKKILITGAAGYIGSMLTTKLVELGYEILAVDLMKYNKNSLSHLFYYNNFSFLKADITKPEVVKKIIKNKDYSVSCIGGSSTLRKIQK